ncbi:MAG: hypothetical protein QME48_03420 [bacterium]|uniref:Uncharacterized protein n=2 Tax=Bacteria candidate phyla TaxID=1783234 RepID=A0A101I179_UNCT6|nr:MAG: hypothetical protein XD76_1402 [candidate division TA06 bacterium 32_111]KUK86768.1 MAG: hypothetical protein XE03_1256 [candidate division TA06 bacterium 34_109]MDI6700262.1 hypothetical protein [bacterium]HAF08304.1 hypothetical protein [candidate division WOR-3 bacterium]HCP16558.1 hypothetical protein [candidate division WOR-3 bacterium]
MFFQSLICEPVFIFPILSFIFNIHLNNSLLILIIIFQTFSIFSLQLGKVSPPNFQIGFVSSLISHFFLKESISFSLLFGIFISIIFGYLYILKRKINYYLSNNFKIEFALIFSVLISYFSYISVLLLQYMILKKFKVADSSNFYSLSLFLVLSQVKYFRFGKKVETLLFLVGILIGVICLKLISNSF